MLRRNQWFALTRGLTLLWFVTPGMLAQQSAAVVSVNGVAYDSLRNAPLAGAFVSLGTRSVTTDSLGRFRFDSVSPGSYTISMQHEVLDSIGITGRSFRANVTDGKAELVLAVPSYHSIWRAACGSATPANDSGFVYGTVRDARTLRPVANATVEVTWVDLDVGQQTGVKQRRWRNQTQTDATGAYGVCSVPADNAVRIHALTDSTASSVIDLAPPAFKIRRRDLLLGANTARDRSGRGAISGAVMTAGAPLRGARVRLDDTTEILSDAAGRFLFRDVPIGTRQLEVLFVGMAPHIVAVDVTPRDTAQLIVALTKVTTLATVNVSASRRRQEFTRALDERRALGVGYYMDSTELVKRPTMFAAFSQFPSVQMYQGRLGAYVVTFPSNPRPTPHGMSVRCNAHVWIDGIPADFEQLAGMRPEDFVVVEAYPRAASVPPRFQVANLDCGVLAVWTKRIVR